jgi:hypothetical protein
MILRPLIVFHSNWKSQPDEIKLMNIKLRGEDKIRNKKKI